MKSIRIITLFMASAAVIAMTSCAKEENPTPEQEQISIIKADIVQPTDEGATKTSLGSLSGGTYPVLWTSSDAIAVSGQSASVYATYTTNDNTQSGTFTLSSGTAPEGEVYAYYPAGNVTSVSSATYTVTIPATQSYAENSFANGAFPMYASATTLEGGLTFQPLMSILKLQLTSTDSKYVKKIVVTSDTENLSGTAQINMSGGAITWTSGNKSVELDCGDDGVELTSKAKTFHIAVPAAASKNYYVAIVTDNSNTVCKGIVKNLTGKTFTVGKIKKMPEVAVAENYIYVEGSYMGDGIAITVSSTTTVWAPVNCGYDATNYKYGKLYQWGRHDGCGYNASDYTKDYNDAGDLIQNNYPTKNTRVDGTTVIEDANTFYWGSSDEGFTDWLSTQDDYRWVDAEGNVTAYNPCPTGWRVPTQAELYALIGSNSNPLGTNSGWDSDNKGSWFNGTTSPKINEGLFLPAAGRREYSFGTSVLRSTYGCYWSSTASSSTKISIAAKYLTFWNANAGVANDHRARGNSIRCVKQ